MKHIYFTGFDCKIFLKHVIWVSFANYLFPHFFSCMKILSSTSLFKHAIIFRIQSRDTISARRNLKQWELSTTVPEMPFTVDLCKKCPVGTLRLCAVSFCAIISHLVIFRKMHILFKGITFLSIWTLPLLICSILGEDDSMLN